SALDQTYGNTEVIVVDDGSTDDSREVIASFGNAIQPIFKQNEGQGSSVNTGFARSTGEFICFLDSDDMLAPTALETAASFLMQSEVVKVHWPLQVINTEGELTGAIKEPLLPDGDFRDSVIDRGPMNELTLPSAPTSGNAYARSFLAQVLPMPA